MPENSISFTFKNHVAAVTLHRPRLDAGMAQELSELAEQINGDDAIYVVTISGVGDVFCAGGEKGMEENYHPAAAVAGIEKPVIAGINGEAAGVGLEIALACDIRIAAEKAVFSLPQVSDGRIPADGGTQRLPRIIGRGKALELLLTGEAIDAAAALEMGLVSRVAAGEALAAETAKLAETIAAKGPLALRYLKEAVIKGMDVTLEQGLRLEADLYFLLHTTSDRTEGIKAFLEKRPPKYEGK